MLNLIVQRRLKAFEQQTGESSEFMQRIFDQTPGLFFRILFFMPLMSFQRRLPKEAYHLARIITVKQEDCGECLQTTVTLAALDKVPGNWILHALNDEWHLLPPPLNLVTAFAFQLAKNDVTYLETRHKLSEYYTHSAMIELASAIASVRFFPTAKKAMGMAPRCQQIQIRVPDQVDMNAA